MAKKQFKAESKRLLDLMINSIYTNKEIFLREIISNASDAIDKLCYLSLTDDKVGVSRDEFRIELIADKAARTLTVRDNGIGMSKEEAENNLGVIARSGSFKFKNEMDGDKAEDISIIGQFGVGFYSAFMVADEVTVISRKYGEESGVKWHSKGADGYTVTDCEKDSVGTDVIMHIKADTEDEKYESYLSEWTLRGLIKKYSDYVRWPIMMDVEKSQRVENGESNEDGSPKYDFETVVEKETLNSMVPIWQRSKGEVSDAECMEFYMEQNRGRKEPCALVRINAEGAVSYKAMLFVPGDADEQAMFGENMGGITLYSNGVMIMEKCEELIRPYFGFVKGIVDSPDLSLNISRELLQHDKQLRIIANNIEKRIKSELSKLMADNRESYEQFFANYGTLLKVGVCEDYGMKKELLSDLLLFHSSRGAQVSLKEYAEKMPESQKAVYYASSDSVARSMTLPQCEDVKKRGYELLYLAGPLDEMLLSVLRELEGKPFLNVVTDDLGLDTEEEKQKIEEDIKANRELLDFVKESLGERVHSVKLSGKLSDKACALSTTGEISLEMEKYFKFGPEAFREIKAQRVLELNAEHSAFASLKAAYENDKEKAAKLALVLVSLAELSAGVSIEDPMAFADTVSSLI